MTSVYTCNLSTTARIITWITSLILLSIVAMQIVFLVDGMDSLTSRFSSVFIIILCTGVWLFYYFQSPKNITLNDEALIINRNLGQVIINRSEIIECFVLHQHMIPMVGSMGFFGFIGSNMGGFKVIITDRHKTFSVMTKNKKFLLSCDEQEDLVKRLNEESTNQ